ncbi:MAG: triacylglycerol lipase [Pseudonocardiales bacterium]|nr:triacylglycerol lipase [Pseudonocardiales bacterium]
MLAAVVLAASLAAPPPASAGTAAPYPVTYDFLIGAVAAGYPFDADPPGANIWTCQPTAQHPRPVVLVHGTFGNKNTNWRTYAPLLANNGYCVYSLTYGLAPNDPPVLNQLGGRTSIAGSAHELADFVARVLQATGTHKVDIVGHSQGTVVPEYYAKFLGGAAHIKNYISLAPLWHGTKSTSGLVQAARVFGVPEDQVPVCPACAQMDASSDFIRRLRAGGVVLPGITYTNIMTTHDELVKPYTSGREAGMTNLVVQDFCKQDFTEHFEIASDPVGAALVLNSLDPAHKRAVPCELVLPFIGPLG